MFPRDLETLAEDVLAAYRDADVRLTLAESCTGGLIAGCLTAIAGSSEVLERGFVTYSNEAKTELLGVPEVLLVAHGAVSEEVARAMAAGALVRSNAEISAAVTGIAFSADGTTIYSVSADKTIKSRPLADPAKVSSLALPAAANSIALINGGKHLVIAGADHALPRGAKCIRLTRIRVVFGKPIPSSELAPLKTRGQETELLSLIRDRIQAEVHNAAAWRARDADDPPDTHRIGQTC